MKIHIIIKTCERYRGTRLKLIRETWLPTVPEGMEYTIAFGGEAPEGGNPDPHVYYTGTPDDYRSLPGKNLAAMRHALETDWDWLFTCDDDTYVCPARLEKLLSEQAEGVYALGCSYSMRNGKVRFIQGGSGYALRREVVEKIISRHDAREFYIRGIGSDEALFTDAVREAGYEWVITPMLRLRGDIKEYYVAQHFCPYTRMKEAHEYLINHPDVP